MEKDQFSKYLQRGQAYQAGPLKAYLKDADVGHVPGAQAPTGIPSSSGGTWDGRGPSDAGAARVVLNYTLIDMLANVATSKMSPEDSLKWGEGQLKAIYGEMTHVTRWNWRGIAAGGLLIAFQVDAQPLPVPASGSEGPVIPARSRSTHRSKPGCRRSRCC